MATASASSCSFSSNYWRKVQHNPAGFPWLASAPARSFSSNYWSKVQHEHKLSMSLVAWSSRISTAAASASACSFSSNGWTKVQKIVRGCVCSFVSPSVSRYPFFSGGQRQPATCSSACASNLFYVLSFECFRPVLRGSGINGASAMASDLRAPWRDGVSIKSDRETRALDFWAPYLYSSTPP